MIDIAAIKARADKATSEPWAKNPFTALWPTDLRTEDQSIADGEFIAHARTDIPALIAALEATEAARVKAEQERDALKEALKPFAHTVPYDFAADHEPVTFTATGGEFRAACRALEAKS